MTPQSSIHRRVGSFKALSTVLALLACGFDEPEPFDGHYPVEALLAHYDDFDRRWCECMMEQLGPFGPPTVEDCQAEANGWREGENRRVCLDRLGHDLRWYKNPWITVCAPEALDAAEELVGDCTSRDSYQDSGNPFMRTLLCEEREPPAAEFAAQMRDCLFELELESAGSEFGTGAGTSGSSGPIESHDRP